MQLQLATYSRNVSPVITLGKRILRFLPIATFVMCLGYAGGASAGPTDNEKVKWLFEHYPVYTGIEKETLRGIRLKAPAQGLGAITMLEVINVLPPTMDYISEIPNLERLTLWNLNLETISFLHTLPKLRELSVLNVTGIADGAELGSLDLLDELAIVNATHEHSWAKQLPHNLKLLHLVNIDMGPIANLEQLTQLQELLLRNSERLKVEVLGGMINLKSLEIDEHWNREAYPLAGRERERIADRNWTVIGDCRNLVVLKLRGISDLKEVGFVRELGKLEGLSITECHQMRDICPVGDLTHLKRLNIMMNNSIADMTCLKPLDNLEELAVPPQTIIYDIPLFLNKLK